MSSVIWPLAYLLIALPMYFLFRRVANSSNRLVENRFSTLSSPNVLHEDMGEVDVVLTLSDRRKNAILVLMLAFVAGGFLVALTAGLSPQPSKQDWQTEWQSIAFIAGLGYLVGGVGPWLMVTYYYGELRAVTRNGILKVSPFTKTFFVRWNQVNTVKIGDWGRGSWWFIVKTEKGSIGIWSECLNLQSFAESIINNVPQPRWAKAERKLLGASDGRMLELRLQNVDVPKPTPVVGEPGTPESKAELLRACRIEIRRLGQEYGIELPRIEEERHIYSKERTALMVDVERFILELKTTEAKAHGGDNRIGEASSRLVKLIEPTGVVRVAVSKGRK